MAVCNGVVTILMVGCIFTLTKGKHRVLWPALAYSIGLPMYHLAMGPGHDALMPHIFFIGGVSLTLAGVLLLWFLAGFTKNEELEDSVRKHSQLAQQSNIKQQSFFPHYLYPILAVLVLFWTNSFTDQLFLPTLNIYFPPGLHPITVTLILAIPICGFIADLNWQRFLKVFVPVVFFLFLLTPSLLLFSRSHPIFLILYTLNVTAIRLITVVFPFVVVDLYWHNTSSGYLAWLLAASIHLIHINALIPAGLFRALSLDNEYAVVLLTLAAVVFFLLSRKLLPGTQEITVPAGVAPIGAVEPIGASPHLADIFREHHLSERETEVAFLLVQEGLSNEEMGERLFVSVPTIKSHVSQIYRKFGVKRRAAFLAKLNNK